MKLKDILPESVLAFPDRSRKVQMDRLRKRASKYDELTGERLPDHPLEQPEEFFVLDQEGKAHGTFDSPQKAEKAIPRLAMKSGKRGLYVKSSME